MKGIQVDTAGADFHLVDDLEKPKPGKGEILLKSVVTAINPVDTMVQAWGILATSWPVVTGCDAGGIVEEVGEGVKDFKPGDKVFGCTRIGIKGYATFQEHFLMDAPLATKVPANVTLEGACTLGGGLYTACLALTHGLKMKLTRDAPQAVDEWVVILGGASSVGQAGIQVGKACGYKVLASSSQKTAEVAKNNGADATFDYRAPEAAQLDKIKEITGGKFRRIFDAVAQDPSFSFKALSECSTLSGEKLFASTNDWDKWALPDGITVERVELGLIGRTGKDISLYPEINDVIADCVPKLHSHLAAGRIKPLEYTVVGKPGMESVLEGLKAQQAGGAGGKKIVVKIAP